MGETAILAKNLCVSYEKKRILSDMDFDACKGELVSVIGPNGAGKTTLLRALSGMLSAESGEVLINGKSIDSYSKARLAKTLSVCFSGRMEAELISCFEVVCMGRYPYTGRFGGLGKEDKEIALLAMRWAGIENLKDKPYQKASDGQKQLVLLARAFAQDTEIILLDEPMSYLDISNKLLFANALKNRVKEAGLCAVASIHEWELCSAVSDRVFCLSRDGRAAISGTPKEVFSNPLTGECFGVDKQSIMRLYSDFAEELGGNNGG